MKTKIIRLSAIVLCCVSIIFLKGTTPNETKQHTIIPKPVSYEQNEGYFKLTDQTVICIDLEAEEEVYEIAKYLVERLSPATGYDYEIIRSDTPKKGSIYLEVKAELEHEEAYTLEVTSKYVKLSGASAKGLFRGIQTLRQMLPPAIEKETKVAYEEWVIQNAIIQDEPLYDYRGMMIDVARHFFTVEEIKRQIDLAAYYKINKMHLHLSDDQGWRIEIKKWPRLTEIGGSTEVGEGEGGFYTQEDFIEIIDYANSRYIEIIPEIDMPGHTNAALASYEHLNPDRKVKDLYTGIEVGFSSLMCTEEVTYEWIDDVIGELASISPSPYIHIGGDEAHSTSKKDYDYFMGRVCEIAKKHGKIPIGWAPAHTAPNLSDDFVLQYWNGEIQTAIDKNIPVIMSFAEKMYLDMQYDANSSYGLNWAGMISTEEAYRWDPTRIISEEQLLGIEAPLWSETIEDSTGMDYLAYPRLLGYAEMGWTHREDRKWEDYKERLKEHGERMDYLGIQYYKAPEIWEKN